MTIKNKRIFIEIKIIVSNLNTEKSTAEHENMIREISNKLTKILL